MGKATRWLRRLWTGKDEEKELKAKPGDDKRVFHAAESEKLQRTRATAVAAATVAATDAAVAAAKAAMAAARLANRRGSAIFSGNGDHWSAVKIQTAFRAYLARKALRALRALVKLQALVRGYLVRRQAAAALRSMQALIRAQEKERLRRSGNVDRDNSARFAAYTVPNFGRPSLTEDSPKIVEIDPGTPAWRFPSLTVSLSDYGEEHRRCSTAHSTPRLLKPIGGELAGYMAKTRSFEAKARSLSAPKQRPEPLMEKKRLSVCERRERKGEPLQVKEEITRGLSSPGKLGQRWRGRYR